MTLRSFSYYDGEEKRWVSNSDDLMCRVLSKVREAFNIKEFKDGGLTEAEMLDLFGNFINHMCKQKKLS